jgi:hypothetical protein
MAKDLFHEAAKIALQKDGWTITHDPYRIDTKQPKFDYEIDLGAERFIGAERGTEKIAVEVKSFVRTSIAYEFHAALGQYITYRIALQFQEPDRTVVLAMPAFAYDKLSDGLQLIIDQTGLDVLCFDTESQTIKSWKR